MKLVLDNYSILLSITSCYYKFKFAFQNCLEVGMDRRQKPLYPSKRTGFFVEGACQINEADITPFVGLRLVVVAQKTHFLFSAREVQIISRLLSHT
jgi:hypothetical protein